MTNNAIALLKIARENVVKNRAAAVQKAAKPFDDEIAAYDKAIHQVSGATPVKVKKATPEKKGKSKKKVAPVKAKKVPVKKAAPAKKVAAKKTVRRTTTGGYPSAGTILEKMSYIISQPKKFLGIQEIAAHVKKHEGGEPADIKRRFSKHIDKFRRQGKIVSYKDKGSNTVYYGLPGYMKDSKPVKAHEPVTVPGKSK
jgi:hypothetical protein